MTNDYLFGCGVRSFPQPESGCDRSAQQLVFDHERRELEPVAHVRTLGLVELIFSYVVSLKLFREKLSAMELGGMALIALGIVIITLGR